MVIKLDHVSYSCDSMEEYKQIISEGYNEVLREENLVNTECKKELLQYGALKHDIILYQSNDNVLPIEVTIYPETSKYESKIAVKRNVIEIFVSDLNAAINFFRCFEMVVISQDARSAMINIVTVFDKNKFFIKLIKDELKERNPFLDNTGYSSVALFVDNIEIYLDKIIQSSFSITKISHVLVNGKKLLVTFVIGRNGEIVELISLDRGGKRYEDN